MFCSHLLRKTALSALIGLSMAAASAAPVDTLVNHGPELETVLGTFAKQGMSYDFNYEGGLVSFVYYDANPHEPPTKFSLYKGSTLIFEKIGLLVGDVFSYSLGAGTYTLTVRPNAKADDILISAVPLPGAAILFGSALLGFFGFSHRRKV